MRYALNLLLALVSLLGSAAILAADPQPTAPKVDLALDWPWWRGPTFDGHAVGPTPPLTWSDSENVLWKALVPGRGHGSPTVVGEQVFLTAAEAVEGGEFAQSVLAFERKTGKELWRVELHRGPAEKRENSKSSLASSSVACDGERLFATFLSRGAVYLTALSLEGKQLWQAKVTDYTIHQGFGASPLVYGELVIAAADNKGNGAMVAYRRDTGEVAWRVERPAKPNYASPIVLPIKGQKQLLLSGCDLVSSFDPLSGKKLWETEGSTTECVTTIVSDGERVFTSGGYPDNHVQAVTADGSGKSAWRNNARVYVPSMLVKDGHLYATLDAGVVTCWNSATGEEKWKERLRGTFSSSLVLIGEQLLATNEEGVTFVFRASPEKFELLGENKLGSSTFSTPTICGGKIYHRAAIQVDGKRQEMLYCIGK